jgi:isoaspartyl peptidase/L-asparaginase-like protein (Ntn-hydrolase superfamily)
MADTATYSLMPQSRIFVVSRSALNETLVPPAGSTTGIVCRRRFSAGAAGCSSGGMISAAVGAVSHLDGVGVGLLCPISH